MTAGFEDVPGGKLVAAVTYLEMREPPPLRPAPAEGCSIQLVRDPDLDEYRRLFRAVGEDWLWCSRLRLTDDGLRAILTHPLVEIFYLMHECEPAGLLELDRREMPDLELQFFGLAPRMIGKGAGRFLMNFAIERAFSYKPARFFLHTCTLDSPKAVEFYLRSGFHAYKRAIEIFDDPRISGELRVTAAPRVPIIR
ncbi:MAG: GNAT family N-acetyltransferase [Acidobacteria bacterium]|nr:GNAT family N-acetyltransferase [Acidobacteriota bacterium]